MADAYQTEVDTDRYLLEDGSGVYLLEATAGRVMSSLAGAGGLAAAGGLAGKGGGLAG